MSKNLNGIDIEDEEYTDEYFEYFELYNGTLEAEIYNTTEKLAVPREFRGKPVTVVSSCADDRPEGRKKVVAVKLSPGLAVIGYQAFFEFRGLKVVNIPATVTEIENGAFGNCVSLEGITVGRGVVSIGNDVFSGCTALRTAKLPDGLVSIGDRAFMNCQSLTEIKIPRLVNSIGIYAFSHCEKLQKIDVDERSSYFTAFCGALYSKDMTELIKYPGSAIGANFLMPESVRRVRAEAFVDATNLRRIFISDNLEEIEDDGFTPLPSGVEPKRIASYLGIGSLYDRIAVFARLVREYD